MKKLRQHLSNGGKLHHFNIVEGNGLGDVHSVCVDFLNFDPKGNSNYHYQSYDTVLVDDAKELVSVQNRRHDSTAVFVIECNSINLASQNALLKVFEEPLPNTYFFLIIPQSNVLLPTLLSRAEILISESVEEESGFPRYDEVKKMSVKDRLDFVSKMVDDVKKEKIGKGDVKKFCDGLIFDMNERFLNGEKELGDSLKKISDVSLHVNDNGSSVKSILEFVVLSV